MAVSSSISNSKDKIILGIDPGTTVMGWGVLMIQNNRMKVLQYGIIDLRKHTDHYLKLQKIFKQISEIVDEFKPDEVALEAPFFGKNVQSMLKLGRAQGVAMAAALAFDIPITEYAPLKVKKSITGKGQASKEQVAEMLLKLVNLKEQPKFLDATDALAVAVTHHFQGGNQTKRPSSWKAFLSQNPGRVK